jgi:hypothetical protein
VIELDDGRLVQVRALTDAGAPEQAQAQMLPAK